MHLSAKDYDVRDFGALGDGVFINSNTIQYAIDYINTNGGGRLVFYPGRYVTGTFYLKSNVTLHLESGAFLLGSTNPWDFVKDENIGWNAMIFACKQDNIGITGKGTIDGRGYTNAIKMADYVHKGVVKYPLNGDRARDRPYNLYFRECNNVTITGITLKDPAFWTQTYNQCRNVYVDDIHVDSKAFWNNDGIDVVDCDGVVIKNSFFDSMDDAICFKSTDLNSICQNVVVDNCTGRSSASGLKFGTDSQGGFRNFKITNLTIYDTFRSAITFAAVDGGLIDNIMVDGVRSINTGNVIFLRTGSRNRGNNGKTSSLKNVVIKNVYAEVPYGKPDAGYNYEGPVWDNPRNISPASIIGLPGLRIENVTLENIEMVYPGRGDSLYAKVGLTDKELDGVPEMEKTYPEFSKFKELPAWGMYIRHADGITFKNVTFRAKDADYRPAVVLDDVNDTNFTGVKIIEPNDKGKEQIFIYKSSNIKID
jgi:polygalacturonase